jgi:hypothetical protein
VPILLVESILFIQTDKQPTQRQLYQIAELGKPDSEPTRAPGFMRLLVDPAQLRIPGEALDFRDEIMAQIYDRGGRDPKAQPDFSPRGDGRRIDARARFPSAAPVRQLDAYWTTGVQ